MTTTPQPAATGLEDGRWIADQRERGASWTDIAIELNTTETEARTLERQFLDHLQAQERERQHTLW